MSREFGVNLRVLAHGDDKITLYDWIPSAPLLYGQQQKYYIHPDSLHIFKARAGDIQQNPKYDNDLHYIMPEHKAHMKNWNIIQREGNPFFTPLTEK